MSGNGHLAVGRSVRRVPVVRQWRALLAVFVVAGMGVVCGAAPAAAGVEELPFPCTSEQTVKFTDLKNEGPRGESVEVGYRVSSCMTGEWTGTIAGTGDAYSIAPERLAELRARGRIPVVDPHPAMVVFHNPMTFWREWIWIAAFLAFALFRTGTMMFAGILSSDPPVYDVEQMGERRRAPAAGSVRKFDRRAPPLRPADRVDKQAAKTRPRISRSA